MAVTYMRQLHSGMLRVHSMHLQHDDEPVKRRNLQTSKHGHIKPLHALYTRCSVGVMVAGRAHFLCTSKTGRLGRGIGPPPKRLGALPPQSQTQHCYVHACAGPHALPQSSSYAIGHSPAGMTHQDVDTFTRAHTYKHAPACLQVRPKRAQHSEGHRLAVEGAWP